MKNRIIFFIFVALLFFTIILPLEAIDQKDPLFADSPVKAAILYFPSPAVMRCLSHSNIPKAPRKVMIYRRIKYPDNTQFEQNLTIGVDPKAEKGSKFTFAGNVMIDGEVFILKVDGGPLFEADKGPGIKPKGLFGLEELIDLQRKIKINKKVGNQNLSYEIFMKNVKGMIGNATYSLELIGKDKAEKGKVIYLLSGKGNLGKEKITVRGVEVFKDYYELVERYGKAGVFTTIRVYD